MVSLETRLALASVLGPFEVHLLKFTLPWNFRLEFAGDSYITTHTRPT